MRLRASGVFGSALECHDVFPAYGVVVEVVGAVQKFLAGDQAVRGQPVAFGAAVLGDANHGFGGVDAAVGLVSDQPCQSGVNRVVGV